MPTALHQHQDFTLKDAEKALGYIDAESLGYDEWANIGRSLAGEFGDDAKQIFLDWCHLSGTEETKAANQYSTFVSTTSNTSIGTLIWHAQQNGYSRYDGSNGPKLSKEERQRLKQEREEANRKKREEQAVERAKNLKAQKGNFSRLKPLTKPTNYLRRKQIIDAADYVDLRIGKDFTGEYAAYPIFDAAGEFRGFERLYSEYDSAGKSIKRICPHGQPSLGFLTIGDIESADQIKVMGGFADAIVTHKVTGETVISVVGEGNIPKIIQQLREAYPEKLFIAAPDNDTAGLEAAKKTGGRWVVPAKEGDDWNDVYCNQGPEQLRQQLQFIQGWEEKRVHQRYLGITIQPGLNLIRSGKETGKSYSISQYTRDNPDEKTLIISYRVMLLSSLAKADRFDADFYQDLIPKEGGGNALLKASHRLVITPDSLWRLAGSHWDTIIVDESEQTLQHFLSTTMNSKVFNLAVFEQLLKGSNTQVLADADLSELTFKFCDKIGMTSGIYHNNTYRPREGSTLYIYDSPTHLQQEYLRDMARGKSSYCCSNSKLRIDNLSKQLELNKLNEKAISISSDNSDDPEILKFVENINEQAPDIQTILGTPSIGTGLSIDKHNFGKTYGFFSHRAGTAEQAHQHLARARGVTEYHVYLDPTEKNDYTNPATIRRLLLDEPTQETADFLGLNDSGEIASISPLYEWLYCEVKAVLNDNKNRFKDRFIAQAKAEGYTIKLVAMDMQDMKAGQDGEQKARDIIRKELREKLEHEPLLTESEFIQAMQGEGDHSQPSLLKTKVWRDFNFETCDGSQPDAHVRMYQTVELAYQEEVKGGARAIKKLSISHLSKEAAKQLDVKDRQFAQSRAELKHTAKRRQHQNRILKAAGLDENLSYDGREWSKKEITEDLRKWLIRNKESLYKYSGINVTFGTLAEPVRWFNDYLRSLGLEVDSRQVREGKNRVHYYGLVQTTLVKVRELVQRRNQGIEEHLGVTAAGDDLYKNRPLDVTLLDSPQPTDNKALRVFEVSESATEKLRKDSGVFLPVSLIKHCRENLVPPYHAHAALTKDELQLLGGDEFAQPDGHVRENLTHSLKTSLMTLFRAAEAAKVPLQLAYKQLDKVDLQDLRAGRLTETALQVHLTQRRELMDQIALRDALNG